MLVASRVVVGSKYGLRDSFTGWDGSVEHKLGSSSSLACFSGTCILRISADERQDAFSELVSEQN